MQENNTLAIVVPSDHPCFVGHFPGDPLVPGALLLQWVCDKLKQASWQITAVKMAKFIAPVRPSQQLTLNIVQKNQMLLVDCVDHEQVFCKLKLSIDG